MSDPQRLVGVAHLMMLLAASVVSTFVGAILGVVLCFVWANIFGVIAIMFHPPIVLWALVHGAMFAAPVTFGVLPVGALLLRGRRLALELVLPAVGLLGGATAMWIWPMVLTTAAPRMGATPLVVAGAVAGLAAGICYGRIMAERNA